jgi:two-component system response regulator
MGELLDVLLVEDNQADAELVIEGLAAASAAEVTVHSVGDGQAALEHLRGLEASERPDMVLLDLNLPRFTGLQTLAELKADDGLRRIPVVVLTTSKSQREINESYERGAAAVLNKPMRLSEHRAMIDSLVSFWAGQVRLPREAL